VLPFQSLGASDQQYFSEGMTDEITSRLASVRDLGVISRSSAMQYQKSDKNTKQIGQELGVDYLLEGTIRWDRSAGATRVRVTPQLIRVADDTQVWSDIYDHVINDVFQVQSEIAQNVITQLGVTLGESQQKNLKSIPTQNLDAYEAYLRGKECFNRPTYDQQLIQQSIGSYQKAVELDPEFALAYAGLARSHLHLFHEGYDKTPERLTLAKTAVDKALGLKPDLPAANVALGYYYYHGLGDYEKALQAFSAALKEAPNDTDTLAAIGFVERRQGKFEESVQHLKSAIELDPRVADLPNEIGAVLTRLRRYAEAERYYDRSLQLAPDQVYGYGLKSSNTIFWKADLKLARAILQKMPQSEPSFYNANWLQQEILERNYPAALERLDKMNVEIFQEEGAFVPKVLSQAMIYYYSNQKEKALEYFDKSRIFLEQQAKERETNPAFHRSLGLTYAGLGRKEDAIREAKRATEILPVTVDAFMGPGYVQGLAEVYIMNGDYDKGLDLLDSGLSRPGWISISWIELHPQFDPLRNLPLYRQLIAKSRGRPGRNAG
jgi:TolB-like protein/Tfp pilus assembly protein PilF